MKVLSITDVAKAAPKITHDVVKSACAKYPWVKCQTMEDPLRFQTIVRLEVGEHHRLVHIDHYDLWRAAQGVDVNPHPFDLIDEAVASMPSGIEVDR